MYININAVPIDDLEGLFNSEAENELPTGDNVVDRYTSGNTSTNGHQIQVVNQFIILTYYQECCL